MGMPDSFQGLLGVVSGHSCSGLFASKTQLRSPLQTHVKSRSYSPYMKLPLDFLMVDQSLVLTNGAMVKPFRIGTDRNRSHFLACQCQHKDGISGISRDDGSGARRKEPSNVKSQLLHEATVHKVLGIQELNEARHENGAIFSEEKFATTIENKHSTQKKKGSCVDDEAWRLLQESIVHYCGTPVGTIAAKDPTDGNILNYDQVFIRDFIPSGIAFLLKGEYDIVRNFILHTLQLQSWEKTMDCHSPGQGLMPASFKVRTVPLDGDDSATEEVLDPDFGEAAIGRVAPVDSGLWWIILLRSYGKCSGDLSVQERIDVQTGIKMILKLCLSDGFDMFPTLLVTDGSCMIDRRMGIHGHPLEIQALFYSALLCAREMLAPEDGSADLIRALNNRLIALSFHIREYYWIDLKKLNEIYRYKTEEYSYDAVNKFNIYPDQISPWLVEWMPDKGVT
ncbi:hypothetical protein HPP92_007573 [Vanilla planifolia]|uniref:Alkaline/neutral invertase n=1 Tax=Vanilla planifolia TaxID=51239 RepID=A0A835RM26_VANPL|nr:hypothetical protein HPP92_007573 [Vanilla planifolia]